MRVIRPIVTVLLAVVLCLTAFPAWTLAQPVPVPVEVLALRTETSKTYRLGEHDYSMELSSGPIHYKQDYTSSSEWWKDIDTTIRNNRVLDAPYTLEIDPEHYTATMTDRRTGSTVTMQLKGIGFTDVAKSLSAAAGSKAGSEYTWSDIVPDGDIKIIAKPTSVAFQYVLKSDKAPTSIEWDVVQSGDGINIAHNVTDAAGPASTTGVAVEWDRTTLRETVITDEDTRYPIRMDPELTVNPDASPESTSVDGLVEAIEGSVDWATLTAVGVGGAAETTNNFNDLWIESAAANNKWDKLGRIFLLFDTSALPDDAVVSAATLSLRGAGLKEDNLNISPTFGIYASDPASDDDLVVGDFDEVGAVALSDTIITYADWDTGDYNDFVLNAAGRAAIEVAGVSKFSFRNKNYDADNIAPSWSYPDDEWSFVLVYMADKGSGYQPKLVITYSIPSDVTVSAATNVKNSSARLPGELTGSEAATITVYWGETDEGEVHAAWDHNSAPTSPAQPQAAGAFYKDVDGLTPGTLYYFKARSVNGGTNWSSTRSFTPPTPVVTTSAATSVAITTAKLNAAVTSLDDDTAEIRFQYYEDGGAFGDHDTAWVDGYSGGQSPYYNASSLTADKLHYFRVQMRVDDTHVYSGATLSFTTEAAAGLSAPTDVRAFAYPEKVVLSWVKGTASTATLVRVGLNDYPDSTTDGTLVGNTTSSSLAHASLTPGTTYYYTLWGAGGADVSAGNVTVMCTTTGGESDDEEQEAPDTPSLWFIPTDYTRFSSMPLYDQINSFIASLSIPLGTGWFLGALLLSVAGGALAGFRARSATAGLTILGAIMLLFCVLQLLPLWMVAFVAIAFLGAAKLSTDRGTVYRQ